LKAQAFEIQMPDNYCGVKLNVAGFEKRTFQRLGQINRTRIVLLSIIKKPRHRKVEKGRRVALS
jgi:hypothetical protein